MRRYYYIILKVINVAVSILSEGFLTMIWNNRSMCGCCVRQHLARRTSQLIKNLISRLTLKRCHKIIAVACQLRNVPTVPLHLTAIFEFNPLTQRSSVPTPRGQEDFSLQLFVCASSDSEHIAYGNQTCVLDFYPSLKVTFYPITSCLWFVLLYIQIRRSVQSALQILCGILCGLILKINLSNGSRAAKYDWRTSLQVHEPTLQHWHSRGLMCETFACETLPFQKYPALQLPCLLFLKIQVRFYCNVELW